MIRFTSLLILFMLSAGTAADSLRISGSTTVLPLLQQIAELYQAANPDTGIQLDGGGSGAGLAALISGDVDIAMSSRFIDTPEVQLALRHDEYPVPLLIAHDAIVPVVHPSNTLRDVSREQLRKIYRKRVANWRELGGRDRRTTVICRDRNSGTRTTWQKLALNGEPASACDMSVASNQAVLEAVRRDEAAIGYVSLAFISANAGVRPLQVEGQACTPECVKTGCYPLTRSLFLFTNGWPEGSLMNFIDFAVNSEQAHEVIRRAGLIPAN